MTETLRPRLGQSPLIGRDDECQLLMQTLDESVRGAGAFVLIEGAAGIGKSRLAREAIAHADTRGFMTLVGACSREDRGVAYAPILDGMHELRRRKHDATHVPGRQLHDVLRDARPAQEEDADAIGAQQTNRTRVTDAMLQFLDAAPAGAGCLAVIEDVHWADHATIRLLTEISRHTRDTRSVLVLTYRDDEIAGSHALGDLLHVLNSSNVKLHTLRLGTLTWSETRTMAQGVLRIGWMPPTAFVDHLYARAEGNPFFTEEILRALPVAATRESPRTADS